MTKRSLPMESRARLMLVIADELTKARSQSILHPDNDAFRSAFDKVQYQAWHPEHKRFALEAAAALPDELWEWDE